MSDFPFTGDEIEEYLDAGYDTPASSSGQCWRVTEELTEALDCFEWLGADHTNNPVKRFEEIGQYGNHFAAYYVDSDTVVDFTFRQFDKDAPYPLLCSKQEWIERLAYVWESDSVRAIIGYTSLDYVDDDFTDDEEGENAYTDYLNAFEFYDCGKVESAA